MYKIDHYYLLFIIYIYFSGYILNKNITLFIFNCLNNDECLSNSCNNKAMQQHGHAGEDVNLNERRVDTISPILYFPPRNHS